jgi:hypothetical protein
VFYQGVKNTSRKRFPIFMRCFFSYVALEFQHHLAAYTMKKLLDHRWVSCSIYNGGGMDGWIDELAKKGFMER